MSTLTEADIHEAIAEHTRDCASRVGEQIRKLFDSLEGNGAQGLKTKVALLERAEQEREKVEDRNQKYIREIRLMLWGVIASMVVPKVIELVFK